jgi:cytochrome c peroxidase
MNIRWSRTGVRAVWLASFVACSSSGDSNPPPSKTESPVPPPPPSLCQQSSGPDGGYPHGEYAIELAKTLPNLAFETDDPDVPGGVIKLGDYFEPCAEHSRLLVVRVSANWCGTCQWQVGHTKELREQAFGSRLRILDLVVADADNIPAVKEDAAPWRRRIDAPDKVAVDPAYQLRTVEVTHRPLPLIVLVDTRTMKARVSLSNPNPEQLRQRIREELAGLDGAPAPALVAPEKVDGLFTRDQWEMIKDMVRPGAPPPDTSNAKGDDPKAAALGVKLFADKTLSPSGTIACASCHDPARDFADAVPQSTGLAKVDRNAPSVALAAHAKWQFWDGRADTLWMQALDPLENAKEAGSSRLFVAHAIFDRYRVEYEGIFGAMPALDNAGRFPASGKPGDPAWQAMLADDQKAVTRVFVNVGKSIAAFERTLRVGANALDEYIGGNKAALKDQEKLGLNAFFTAGCAQCHYGPRLTDDAFHAVRFPTGRQDGTADRGRLDGVAPLLMSEFNAASEYSDDRSRGDWLSWLDLRRDEQADRFIGTFKTPALRGVPATGPYGHGGTLATLADVVDNYSKAGLPATDARAVGATEPWVPEFSDEHKAPLEAFLKVLTGPVTH